jgi:hypothetical protein
VPSSVRAVFQAANVSPLGCVPWGTQVPEGRPGVYAVALTPDPNALGPTLLTAPIDPDAVGSLLERRPELLLDGTRPTADQLSERVASFWLPGEVILYIGLAGTSLRARVDQYYRTPLGARRPHSGGWFLKLLANLDELFVHFAVTDDPEGAEFRALEAFCAYVSSEDRSRLRDPAHPFPFANLEWPRGTRKAHGISGARGDLPQAPATERSRSRPQRAPRPAPAVGSGGGRVAAISEEIQRQLRIRGMDTVTAVEAARWLDSAGLLKDSPYRPGLPLRNLLREGRIPGQRQEPNHRWFIDRL